MNSSDNFMVNSRLTGNCFLLKDISLGSYPAADTCMVSFLCYFNIALASFGNSACVVPKTNSPARILLNLVLCGA